jgi:hypothetical protein
MGRNVNEEEKHSIFVGKPEGKRSLGRPRNRWEDSVKLDFKNSVKL